MMAISQLEFSNFTRGLSLHRLTKIYIFNLQKSVPEIFGGRGGKGDLEKSRFDWVFINDGVPNQDKPNNAQHGVDTTILKAIKIQFIHKNA